MITNDPSPLTNSAVINPEAIQEQIPTPAPQAPLSPWSEVGLAFLAWLSSVALLVVVPLAAIIPYIVYLMATGSAPSAANLTQDKTFLFLSIAAVIPAHALTLLGIWIVVTRWGKKNFWQTLQFSWPRDWAPWQGVVICFAMASVLLGLGFVVTKFLGGNETDLDKLIQSSYSARVATAFLAVATAPLVEEIIYRGMLYPALQRLLGMGWAVVVVTIMFAGVHVPQYKNNIGVIVVITVLSVVLTLVRAFSDRLLPSVVIHLIFNGVQSLILVVEPFIQKSDKIEPAPTLNFLYNAIHHLF